MISKTPAIPYKTKASEMRQLTSGVNKDKIDAATRAVDVIYPDLLIKIKKRASEGHSNFDMHNYSYDQYAYSCYRSEDLITKQLIYRLSGDGFKVYEPIVNELSALTGNQKDPSIIVSW